MTFRISTKEAVSDLFDLCGLIGNSAPARDRQPSAMRAVPKEADWSRLIAAADEHCLTPSLVEALRHVGPEDAPAPDDVSYLSGVGNLNADRNKAILAQLGGISSALNAAGVDFMFLKGSALLIAGIYPTPGCRFIGDIDILIRSDHVERAGAVFLDAGYFEQRPRYSYSHEIMFLSHPGRPAALDVHQFIVNIDIRDRLPEDSFLAGKVAVALPEGIAAYVPAPEDMIAHNIWHAMVHHPHLVRSDIPLRDAFDLCLLSDVCRDQIDWTRIEERLNEDGRGPAILDFYCNTARALFRSDHLPRFPPTPEGMLSRLRWRSRGGRRAYPYEDHGPLGNVAEKVGWKCLVDREWRSMITRKTLEFRKYGSHMRRIREIAGGPDP